MGWGSVRDRRVKGRTYHQIYWPLIDSSTGNKVPVLLNNRRDPATGYARPFRGHEDAQSLLNYLRERGPVVGARRAVLPYSQKTALLGRLGQFFGAYLADLVDRAAAGEVSANTEATYRSRLRKGGPFGVWWDLCPEDVTARGLKKWKLSLLANHKDKTAREYMRLFRTWWAWAEEEEPPIVGNPPTFPKIRLREEGKAILSADEPARVCAAIKPELRGIFLFMCLGVRPNAARVIQVQDYDRGFFHIRRSIQGQARGKPIVPWEKNGKSPFMCCTEELAQWILKYRATAGDTDLLFLDPKGLAFYHAEIAAIWEPACWGALGKYVPPYRGTKHSFATEKAMEGYSVDEIATHLGVTPRTAKIYIETARQRQSNILGDDAAKTVH